MERGCRAGALVLEGESAIPIAEVAQMDKHVQIPETHLALLSENLLQIDNWYWRLNENELQSHVPDWSRKGWLANAGGAHRGQTQLPVTGDLICLMSGSLVSDWTSPSWA